MVFVLENFLLNVEFFLENTWEISYSNLGLSNAGLSFKSSFDLKSFNANKTAFHGNKDRPNFYPPQCFYSLRLSGET